MKLVALQKSLCHHFCDDFSMFSESQVSDRKEKTDDFFTTVLNT